VTEILKLVNSCPVFLDHHTQSKLDGTYIKFLSQIEKTQLLIIDDWGLYPLDINSRLALLQVLEDRYAAELVKT
jgi:DNA replication protein DnaC